jgi:putative RecB family exonuclease
VSLEDEQQELAGMPAPLYPCTPTRLNTWQDCPRRYRFSYLDRPQPPKGAPWAHNSVGAAVHSALADWWSLPVRARTATAGATLVRRRWLTDGFRDGVQSALVRDRAVEWVAGYLSELDAAEQPAGVERTVSTRTSTLVLAGRVDRIDYRRSGGLVIVDYKTGGHVPGADDARSSLALAVYAVAAARTYRRACSRVELHHLPSGSRAVAEHSPGELDAKVAEAESIGRDCSGADTAYLAGRTGDAMFPPRPSKQCSWCDFRRHCPEGRAAAPDREPWAAFADISP